MPGVMDIDRLHNAKVFDAYFGTALFKKRILKKVLFIHREF